MLPPVAVASDWTPWIIGSIELAAVVWLYQNKQNNATSPVVMHTSSASLVPVKHNGFSYDLKVKHDPFYMQ